VLAPRPGSRWTGPGATSSPPCSHGWYPRFPSSAFFVSRPRVLPVGVRSRKLDLQAFLLPFAAMLPPGLRSSQRLCCALLLPFLLAGMTEVHHHGPSATSNTSHVGESRVNRAAVHPYQPCHVEAGGEEDVPACAACQARLAARSLQAPTALIQCAHSGGERLPLESDRIPSDPRARWVGGRSPPLG